MLVYGLNCMEVFVVSGIIYSTIKSLQGGCIKKPEQIGNRSQLCKARGSSFLFFQVFIQIYYLGTYAE